MGSDPDIREIDSGHVVSGQETAILRASTNPEPIAICMLPEIFSSPQTLHTEFEAGLERQLGEEGLGTFILVLANALFEDTLFQRMRDRLEQRFREIRHHYAEYLRHGRALPDAPDDVLVFLKLVAMRFRHLVPTDYRHNGAWELQFNQVRSLRPKRMSGETITHLSRPFDPDRFHFDKGFLDKEVLWQGEMNGMGIKLLYNKFPFAPLHGLLVPEPEQHHAQILKSSMHGMFWQLTADAGKNIPGIGFAYNAFGAGASINHLHLQMFVRQTALPVLDSRWSHNGGPDDYPTQCMVFNDSDRAWQAIADLHHANITYNLVYLPGRMLCLPRRFQGSFELPAWCENLAWYEMCGGMTTYDMDDYNNLNQQEIVTLLASSRPQLSF